MLLHSGIDVNNYFRIELNRFLFLTVICVVYRYSRFFVINQYARINVLFLKYCGFPSSDICDLRNSTFYLSPLRLAIGFIKLILYDTDGFEDKKHFLNRPISFFILCLLFMVKKVETMSNNTVQSVKGILMTVGQPSCRRQGIFWRRLNGIRLLLFNDEQAGECCWWSLWIQAGGQCDRCEVWHWAAMRLLWIKR